MLSVARETPELRALLSRAHMPLDRPGGVPPLRKLGWCVVTRYEDLRLKQALHSLHSVQAGWRLSQGCSEHAGQLSGLFWRHLNSMLCVLSKQPPRAWGAQAPGARSRCRNAASVCPTVSWGESPACSVSRSHLRETHLHGGSQTKGHRSE